MKLKKVIIPPKAIAITKSDERDWNVVLRAWAADCQGDQRETQRGDEKHDQRKGHVDDVEARQQRRKRDEGSDRAVVNQHLHHRAQGLAADDLHGRKRRDLQQLKRCLGPLFDNAAKRRERNDDQRRRAQSEQKSRIERHGRRPVVDRLAQIGHAENRPGPRRQKQEQKSDHELAALERLAHLLHDDGIEPVAQAFEPGDQR